MLHSIVYLSSSTSDLTEEELSRILSTSRANNNAVNITGVLLYGKGSFIQVLEGEKLRIEGLFSKIKEDIRHTGVILLLSMDIFERNFPAWRMGFKKMKDTQEIDLLNEQLDFKAKMSKNFPVQSPQIFKLLQTFKEYNYPE